MGIDNQKNIGARQRINAKRIRKVTNGIFSTITDVTLFTLFLIGASLGKRGTSRDVYKTFSEADELLLKINYQTFQTSLNKLKNQGLISSLKNWAIEPIITRGGMLKLLSITPIYDEKRIWDHNLYLISYDIDTSHNTQRARFRFMLKRIGTIKLQESLYLTCYNPEKIFSDFLKENDLEEDVLISHLGKDGFIGQDDLKELLWNKANLNDVNNRYREFIQKYRNKSELSKTQIAIDFYSILQDDPQLPFELLPDTYLGDEVYLFFQKLNKKLPI